MEPAAVTEVVKDSNLRGRGGAAFPPREVGPVPMGPDAGTKYLLCNADEMEPAPSRTACCSSSCRTR